jgi:hypothetical protein
MPPRRNKNKNSSNKKENKDESPLTPRRLLKLKNNKKDNEKELNEKELNEKESNESNEKESNESNEKEKNESNEKETNKTNEKEKNESNENNNKKPSFMFSPPPALLVMLDSNLHNKKNNDDDDNNSFDETPVKRKRESFEDYADIEPLEPNRKKQEIESLKDYFNFDKYKFNNFDNFVKFMDSIVFIWDRNCHSKAELYRIKRLIPTLRKMSDFVGNEEAKENIIKLIINHLLKINYLDEDEYYEEEDLNLSGMMHSVFSGPPGTGKTEFAKLVGKVFVNIGLLSEDSKFLIKRRDDFIAGYLGQTAIKTRKVLNEAIGNVLFIDEAYSLGCGDKIGKDSFSKETIDLLVEFMSNHKNDTAIFFAGYKDSLEKDLFGMNPGLERRVAWRFDFKDYKAKDLCNIFKTQINREYWNYEFDAFDEKFFEDNIDFFKNNGGDTENLFAKCKMVNSFRKFVNRYFDSKFQMKDLKKCVLTKEDVEKGLKCHIENYNNDKIESKRIKKEILDNMFL